MINGQNIRSKKIGFLVVASKLFYHQGYNQTGINQIIAEAEIAIGSLYNHFPSKTDLLIAYLLKEHEKWFEGFIQFTNEITEPKQKLLKLLDYKISLQEISGFAGCHFIKIADEIGKEKNEVSAIVKAHKEQQCDLIKKIVYDAQVSTLLDKDLVTDAIFLLMEGGTSTATIYNNTDALKKARAVEGKYYRFKIILNQPNIESGVYFFKVNSLDDLASEFSQSLKVLQPIKTSSILEMSLSTEMPLKGITYLNKFIDNYIFKSLDEKNRIAENTIAFIDSQLLGISDSLYTVENKLQKFRTENQIFDLSAEGQKSYNNLSDLTNQKSRELIFFTIFCIVIKSTFILLISYIMFL